MILYTTKDLTHLSPFLHEHQMHRFSEASAHVLSLFHDPLPQTWICEKKSSAKKWTIRHPSGIVVYVEYENKQTLTYNQGFWCLRTDGETYPLFVKSHTVPAGQPTDLPTLLTDVLYSSGPCIEQRLIAYLNNIGGALIRNGHTGNWIWNRLRHTATSADRPDLVYSVPLRPICSGPDPHPFETVPWTGAATFLRIPASAHARAQALSQTTSIAGL